MTKLHLLSLIAFGMGMMSCAPRDAQPSRETAETGNKTFFHEGQFASYHVETAVSSTPKGLHRSTFTLKTSRDGQPLVSKTLPVIIHPFTYYDVDHVRTASQRHFDVIVIKNGQSTGEEGHAVGAVIIGMDNEIALLSWTFDRGQIKILGTASDTARQLAYTSIEQTSQSNQSWSW